MITAILLLLLGLLMIFLEFYLPGAIMGVGGTIVIIVSVVLFAQATDSPLAVLAYLVVVVLAIAGLIHFTLKRIRATAKEGTIYLQSDQEGYVASEFDRTLIGQHGIAASDLKPSGHIKVESRLLQAVSEVGYVTKGTAIAVMGGRGAYLLVKPVKEEKRS